MPKALCINVVATLCRRHIGRRVRATEAVEFFNVLTSPELPATAEALLPKPRERLYPPTVALSMPNTPENQAVYPQPSTQAPGVGFPLAGLVMVICLATGAALDMAMGPHSGKGSGELGLVRRLLECFSPGDVMLADALYCNYFLIATLMGAGVDVLFEQNGSRITDFRRGQSLGTRDHVVCWPKPARPEWMTPEQYARAPDELRLREVKVTDQVRVTTLLDHQRVSKDDLSALYARRWNVELDLRNLKTTTGMDVLSCQTPQMNEKQLWVHLLAYNVIRLLMAQAACDAGAVCDLSVELPPPGGNDGGARGVGRPFVHQMLGNPVSAPA